MFQGRYVSRDEIGVHFQELEDPRSTINGDTLSAERDCECAWPS
jgi:hypothetical protein